MTDKKEIDYTKNLNFWLKTDPSAVYDYVKDGKGDISSENWFKVCTEVQRRGE